MGQAPDLYQMSFSGNERDPLFINLGNGKFEDRGYQARTDLPGDGRAQAWVDLDGDGDLDLVVRQLQAPKLVVLRNDSTSNNKSIEVSLVGTHSNRMGVGALVKACVGTTCQTQELHAGHGFMSSAPVLAHFGLGTASAADVSVTWPTGEEQKLGSVPAGAKIRATEGKPGFETLMVKPFALGPAAPPPLTLQSLAAAAKTSDALTAAAKSGKPTLVNLWAPWCKPCREEAPHLVAFERQSGAKVSVVALSMEPDLVKDAAAAHDLGLGWPLAAATPDQEAILARALDSIDLPATLAFDAHGKLVDAVVGKVGATDLARLGRAAGVAP